MIRAVYDCNVILSGIGWNGSARKCLRLIAERRVFLFATEAILAEYEAVIPETLAEEAPEVNPYPKLAWIKSKTRVVGASPLGKRRSRDAKDDVYLAAALGASASPLISFNNNCPEKYGEKEGGGWLGTALSRGQGLRPTGWHSTGGDRGPASFRGASPNDSNPVSESVQSRS